MTEAGAPTLKTLEANDAPCLLWDSDRLRAVWANPAALKLFGAASLFELVDRPFDPGEPGPALIRSLKAELGAGQRRKARLCFPSVGPTAEFEALCWLHELGDGRQGVLSAGEAPQNRLAENALAESAAAFSALPQAAAVVEADGRFSVHNGAADEFLSHVKQRTLGDLFEDAAAAEEFLKRVAKAGTVCEVRKVRTGLGIRELRLTARRVGPASIDAQKMVIIFEDLTERRALERQLRASPASAREPTGSKTPPAKPEAAAPAPAPAVSPPASKAGDVPAIIKAKLEALPQAIVIYRDGKLLYANAQALQLLKLASQDALVAHGLVDRLAMGSANISFADAAGEEISVDVERSPVPWNQGAAIQATLVALTKQAVQEPSTNLPEAGPAETSAQLEEPIQPAPVETTPSSAQASWKLEDSELSAILDTASDGIITLDADGLIRSFSAGAEAIFVRPKADVLGRPFADLLTIETAKIFRDYLAALSDSGLTAVFNDGREVVADVGAGKSMPLFLTISRLHGNTKTLQARPAFCAVVRDITQWKQTEAELRDAKERAEQTSRQKSEFLARISHELRTPLNAILGFSEVMRLERFGKLQNEKYRDYVSDIHTSGAHLLSLINDLLDLSKVEAGKLELNFTSVSLPEVTENAMRLLADKAQQGRVVVKRNFPPELPNVVADLRSMRQIMINLISNAIKFTDPGGQVTVTGRVNKAGELVLRIKDTGIGMNAEELKGALEPFRRITSATRSEKEGTGLGLPLTKALTEANRAAFAISSEPGKGTLIEIIYPTTRVLAD